MDSYIVLGLLSLFIIQAEAAINGELEGKFIIPKVLKGR